MVSLFLRQLHCRYATCDTPVGYYRLRLAVRRVIVYRTDVKLSLRRESAAAAGQRYHWSQLEHNALRKESYVLIFKEQSCALTVGKQYITQSVLLQV